MNQFAQKKDGWCGPAALCYALHDQGVDVSQDELAKESGTTVSDGVDPYPLEKVAKAHGMETVVLRGGDPNQQLGTMSSYLDNGWSVILDYLQGESYEDGHYSVLLDVSRDSVRIFDPSNEGSEKTLDRENFIEHWKDMDDEGKTFKYYALILGRGDDDA